MGITVSYGSSYSSTTSTRGRLEKGPGAPTEQIQQTAQDGFTFSGGPAAAGAPEHTRFKDLDPGDRRAYLQTVKSLASDGRLFVKEDSGSLRRADPMEIKERLDQGKPVQVVSRVASESSSSGSYASGSSYKERGLFTEGWNVASSSSQRSSSERVHYSTSAVTEWDSLEFADEAPGIKGVAKLPASGGSVVVSSSFESEWSSRASRQWGVFTEKSTSESSGGFARGSYTAE